MHVRIRFRSKQSRLIRRTIWLDLFSTLTSSQKYIISPNIVGSLYIWQKVTFEFVQKTKMGLESSGGLKRSKSHFQQSLALFVHAFEALFAIFLSLLERLMKRNAKRNKIPRNLFSLLFSTSTIYDAITHMHCVHEWLLLRKTRNRIPRN